MSFITKFKKSMQADKTQHFIIGFAFAIILMALDYNFSPLFFQGELIPLIGITLLGFGIEFAQSFTKTRHVEYATIAGGVHGILLFKLMMVFYV
jgi:hypothetical protein